MPEVAQSVEAVETKAQPWKASWPAGPQDVIKAGNMAKGGSGNGMNAVKGYNEKGEAVESEPRKA